MTPLWKSSIVKQCLQNCELVVLSAICTSLNTISYRSINLLGPKRKNAYLGSFVNRGIFTRLSLSSLKNGRPEHTKRNRGHLTKAILIMLNWTRNLITKAQYLANTAPLFTQLKVLDIFSINSFSVATFMYSYHHNLLPNSFSWLVLK